MPPGMTLTENGRVHHSAADTGAWDVVLTLRDDDGGVRRSDLLVRVKPDEPLFDLDLEGCSDLDLGGCCCCGGSSGILRPPLLLLRIRRRTVL